MIAELQGISGASMQPGDTQARSTRSAQMRNAIGTQSMQLTSQRRGGCFFGSSGFLGTAPGAAPRDIRCGRACLDVCSSRALIAKRSHYGSRNRRSN